MFETVTNVKFRIVIGRKLKWFYGYFQLPKKKKNRDLQPVLFLKNKK